ncbi:MAG: hypothetical protein ABI461_05280 [Polyangiaceae bacterium]
MDLAAEDHRRVSLLRAVLAAHFTATRNRVARELGRFGSVVMAIVLAGLTLTLAVPLLLSFGALGFLFAQLSTNVAAVPVLATLIGGVAVGGGILSGAAGGAKQLTWESYRVYPARFWTLFLAEIIAGLGDMFPAAVGAALFSILGGVAIAAPRSLLVAPFVLLEGITSAILVQLIVSSLASVLVRKIRIAFFLLFLLPVFVGIVLDTFHPSAATLAEIERAARYLAHLLEISPIGMATQSLSLAAHGSLKQAFLMHIAPLASVAALGWVTSRVILVDLQPSEMEGSGATKLWSFTDPANGIAKLSWHTIMGSQVGRFGFIVPLFAVVVIRGPLSQLVGRGPWTVPAAFMYVSLSASSLQLNQFGLDGHGVKCLFFLPIRIEDILRGKTRGLALYQAAQSVLLSLLLPFACHVTPNEIAAGLLMTACFFFVQSSVGRFTSVSMPRAVSRTQMRASSTPVTLVLLGLAISAGSSAVFGGAYGLMLHFEPRALVPVMGALALTTFFIHQSLTARTAIFAARNRDRLLAALG